MAKKINGILCNDAGQPITTKNGYSSEDTRELEERETVSSEKNQENNSEYRPEKELTKEELEELEAMLETEEEYEIIDGMKFKDGYLCNEEGLPINMENGYSSEDEDFAMNVYREHKYHYEDERE